jgi:hypothetical protein
MQNAERVPGGDLLRFAGAVSADDLNEMTKVIAEGREQVDAHFGEVDGIAILNW